MKTEGGLIVNGHVPVKVEAGESPLKRSGKAITIDGAFSEAYGDYGYTLLLEPDRILLAQHSHFDSVESAIHKVWTSFQKYNASAPLNRPAVQKTPNAASESPTASKCWNC